MSLPFQTKEDLLRGMAAPDRAQVAGRLVEKRYPRDAVIFGEGDTADALCIVKSGLVKLVSISEEGRETILAILRPGDLFGEPIVPDARRPYSARAIDDAIIEMLPRGDLARLMAAVPGLSANVLVMLARRLLRLERSVAGLINAWAHHRLARELLRLSEELGVETAGGTRISLRLTHEELSNLIGASRETVTLLLRKFDDMGFIRRDGRHIVVNRARIAEYARIRPG